MKIALIGPVHPFRGGIAHYTTMLDLALRAAGHSVLLVSFRRQYPAWLFPGHSDRDPSHIPLAAEEAHYWIDSLNPFSWWRAFLRIRRHRPQLLVLQWWTTFWTPVWLTLIGLNRLALGAQLLFICHNVVPHEARRWDRWAARWVLRWAQHCIVQSEVEKARLLALLPEARPTVAPMPVFDMFAHHRVERQAARRQLGLPASSPILLFFGHVREYKGLRTLLAALPAVRQEIPDLLLVVAGEFWDDKAAYLHLIEQEGLQDAVIVDDRYIPNEEVALYFSAADVLVAPYQRVTGSAVAQMAAGFGLPAITNWGDPTDGGAPADQPMFHTSAQIAQAIVAFFATAGNEGAAPPGVFPPPRSWRNLVEAIEQCASSS